MRALTAAAGPVIALALGLVLAGCRHAEVAQERSPVARIQVLAVNDFHGNLEPTVASSTDGSPSYPAGGAVPLSQAISALKSDRPHTLLVAAGDLVGASPLASALLRDEPTVALFNHLGMTASAVGNHELDHGLAELLRLQHGGCATGDCEPGEQRHVGARFTYLSANLIDVASGRTAFPPYRIHEIDGVRIAFVGALARSAAETLLAENFRGLRLEDEAASINALVPQIRAEGARAIVVLLHEGARAVGPVDARTCSGLEGPAMQIVTQLDPEIDLVISGHSHRAYVCRLDARLLTQAGSYGHWITAIDLEVDRATGQVVTAHARNVPVPVDAAAAADPVVGQLVADAVSGAAKLSEQAIARLRDGQIRREGDAGGDSPLGRLVADAQVEAAKSLGADVACMNRGGLRQDLPATSKEGPVTYGDVYATQPFGNRIKVLAMSGAQLTELLEQQWKDRTHPYVLSCSQALTYRYDLKLPPGGRLVPGSLQLAGTPIAPQREYRLAVNSFLAGGGDAFSVLTRAREIGDAGLDLDALVAYLRAHEPVETPPPGRIQAETATR